MSEPTALGKGLPNINGAEMQRRAVDVKRQVMNIVEDIQLRKWCVSEVLNASKTWEVFSMEELETACKKMYDFITNKENDDVKSA